MAKEIGKDDTRDPELYALVSGAGSVVMKDGLVAVVLIEKTGADNPKESLYKTSVYGEPAIVLIQDEDKHWHITGPVGSINIEELLLVAESLRRYATGQGGSAEK